MTGRRSPRMAMRWSSSRRCAERSKGPPNARGSAGRVSPSPRRRGSPASPRLARSRSSASGWGISVTCAFYTGSVLEPALRSATAVAIECEQRLTRLPAEQFVGREFGYPYTLKRALDAAMRLFRDGGEHLPEPHDVESPMILAAASSPRSTRAAASLQLPTRRRRDPPRCGDRRDATWARSSSRRGQRWQWTMAPG